jgi:hypothetical protein
MEEDASMIEQAEKKYDTRKVEFEVLELQCFLLCLAFRRILSVSSLVKFPNKSSPWKQIFN